MAFLYIVYHTVLQFDYVCAYLLSAAVIGIRLHWAVALSCILMALYVLILK